MLLVLDDSKGSRLFVGRDSRCDLVLEDPMVSRRHARITFRDGVWMIHDLSSTNGTTLNGERVGRATLRPGDILRLGHRLIQVD
jgi:pSer/pThr/pTyr-binding forkhead associated (FHA) protein